MDLPGIGVRHDLVTENGRRLGVVSYRDGDRELTISDADDPDACAYALPINEDEAEALADLFGASVAISRLTKLTDETDGLYTEKIELPADSPFVRPHARRHEDPHAHARLRRRHHPGSKGDPVPHPIRDASGRGCHRHRRNP